MRNGSAVSGLVVLMALVLSGCASDKIPLTSRVIHQYQLSHAELHKLQYYVSDDAVFNRELDPVRSREIKEGELITETDSFSDVLVIEKETPGVLESIYDDGKELHVSFEKGSKFPFKSRLTGKYKLKTRTNAGRKLLFPYNNKYYSLVNQGTDIHLLISKKDLEDREELEHVLEGRYIDEE